MCNLKGQIRADCSPRSFTPPYQTPPPPFTTVHPIPLLPTTCDSVFTHKLAFLSWGKDSIPSEKGGSYLNLKSNHLCWLRSSLPYQTLHEDTVFRLRDIFTWICRLHLKMLHRPTVYLTINYYNNNNNNNLD